MNIAKRLLISAMALALLAACDPFAEKRAKRVEEKRIDCVDKFCEGDNPPKPPTGYRNMKVNEQQYFVPQQYLKGFAGVAFYWPSKTPVTGREDGAAYPELGGAYSEVAIEVFLTGRKRWPNPEIAKPWEGKGWEARFDELQKQGWRITRQQLNPDLEHVRFSDTQGKLAREEYFLTSKQHRVRGESSPGISCRYFEDPKFSGRCTGDEFWQEDVYVDFRFSAKHAQDWPAIHQEILRVLQLIKKAE